MLIEILLSVGRSVKVKKKIVADIVAAREGARLDPDDVMIVFKETHGKTGRSAAAGSFTLKRAYPTMRSPTWIS